ncbi:hypothetical protein RhiXN_05159 [Rhizoctonia solani]|uniref:Uncharacterized protein n=1 Tax=Rhizoctonia solani TaxID=456999 RepID=A0A8H8SUA0_9AGAM|nr:uncharacterized protein RhiXN_05159 [Rhizoctonia solani]QRW17157.1 hypothetical protein RhiXN_05159 [Rhizoctonia solani]
MFFSFTFSLPTPFANPFDASTADPGQLDYSSPERTRRLGPRPARPNVNTTPERSANISRKRGRWSPEAKAGPSSVLDLTSTASAYIDSPARYVDFSEQRDEPEEAAEIRAPKRRRIAELADSVISTAFSAAVIGTAVGLTAYRLWRDRGKDGLPINPEPSTIESFPPPPPYTPRVESEHPSTAGPSYIPIPCPAPTTLKMKNNLSSAPATTPRRRANTTRRQHVHTSAARRRRPVNPVFPRNQSPASSLRRSTAYHTAPDSSRSTPAPAPVPVSTSVPGPSVDNEDMEMSGHMDWMSSQLQALINEGKRALGAEVVVGGADEVDDGAEGWTSADEDGKPKSAHSRAQSRATTRPVLGRSTSRTSKPRHSNSSTSHARSGSASGSSSVKKYEDDEFGIEVLYQSPIRSAPSATGFRNEDGTSEQLQIAMERVRKAYGLT